MGGKPLWLLPERESGFMTIGMKGGRVKMKDRKGREGEAGAGPLSKVQIVDLTSILMGRTLPRCLAISGRMWSKSKTPGDIMRLAGQVAGAGHGAGFPALQQEQEIFGA